MRGQGQAVDVHVEGSWVDAGKIGVQDILVFDSLEGPYSAPFP